MKKITLLIVIAFFGINIQAQKIFTKTANITFHSDAPLEKIEATNSKATTVIDTESGAMQWAVLIKAFKFEKSLMEEHFNENYMESSKYPKGTFTGKIDNLDEIKFTENGDYSANVSGKLTIHGESKEVSTVASLKVVDGKINGTCEFEILLEDYKIEIPSVVADNISKTVLIKVNADYEMLAK